MTRSLRVCDLFGSRLACASGPISRGSVSLLFALIKDELSEPVGAEVDSKGGGAIYAAALQTAAKSTFALTHPSNLRESKALTAVNTLPATA